MPHKTWAVGEEVLAADFQTYLQDQTIPQFPNIAARNTWLAPPAGAVCVVADARGQPWIYLNGKWMILSGTVLAHVEMSTEVGWTAASATVLELAQALPGVLGQRYVVNLDIQWRGTVLNDVHEFALEQGTGPAGDFTTRTTLRQWAISPSRASVSGSSEHFSAQFVWWMQVVQTSRLRITGRRLGGTGSAYVVQSAIDVIARHDSGTG